MVIPPGAFLCEVWGRRESRGQSRRSADVGQLSCRAGAAAALGRRPAGDALRRGRPMLNQPPTRPSLAADMKILLLGSGGREHALAWKIAASPLTDRLFCAPGNARIAQEAGCVALDLADHSAVIAFCRANQVDFVVV